MDMKLKRESHTVMEEVYVNLDITTAMIEFLHPLADLYFKLYDCQSTSFFEKTVATCYSGSTKAAITSKMSSLLGTIR